MGCVYVRALSSLQHRHKYCAISVVLSLPLFRHALTFLPRSTADADRVLRRRIASCHELPQQTTRENRLAAAYAVQKTLDARGRAEDTRENILQAQDTYTHKCNKRTHERHVHLQSKLMRHGRQVSEIKTLGGPRRRTQATGPSGGVAGEERREELAETVSDEHCILLQLQCAQQGKKSRERGGRRKLSDRVDDRDT